MAWDDNPDLVEPKEGGDLPPAMSLLGDLRRGDEVVLRFDTDGEERAFDTGTSPRAAFGVTVAEIVDGVTTWDDDPVEEGDEVELITASSRLLSRLKEHAPVSGKTLRIVVEDTGYDAAYSVTEE